MKYLILSDLHSNMEALTAVLRRVRRKRFDRIIVLGDVVGYGAEPNRMVEKIRRLKKTVIIRGNHDKVCSGIESGEMFNSVAYESAQWTKDKLQIGHRTWLASLPKGLLTVDDEVAISHGTPLDEDAYIFGEIEALNMFNFFAQPLCLFGHSHFPVIFGLDSEALTTFIPDKTTFRMHLRTDTRYLINPGSVGQPRDGDNRASFGILDMGKRTMTILRVPYDFSSTQERILAAGLPALLAQRLAVGR